RNKHPKNEKARAVISVGIIILVVTAWGTLIYRWVTHNDRVAHFSDVNLTQLTNSGNAIDATISPDGKYIVYVLSDRSRQSLYIRQVGMANDKEIVPPAPVGYFGIAFSPDGTEIYYAIKQNLSAGTLYRVPVLGGIPVKVLERIDAPVTFSPDGKQFALIRGTY